MLSPEHGVVGILAGAGSLPREVAQHVTARGGRVHVVTLGDGVDVGLADFPVTKADMAKVGTILRAFRNAGCRKLVIVGAVTRPDLGALWPDLGFFLSLPAILRLIATGGDDDLLSSIVRFFEGKGFEVVAPAAMAPELLAGAGPLGKVVATERAGAGCRRGIRCSARHGALRRRAGRRRDRRPARGGRGR